METIEKIRNRIAIYIVDYSIEWSDALYKGIECTETFFIKKLSNGEDFINFIR